MASPVYFLSVNSSIKKIFDRGVMFYKVLEEVWGRPVVAVSVRSINSGLGLGEVGLRLLVKFLGFELRGSFSLRAAFPGGILEHTEVMERATETLTRDLCETEGECSGCGGKVVSMEGEFFTSVRCGL